MRWAIALALAGTLSAADGVTGMWRGFRLNGEGKEEPLTLRLLCDHGVLRGSVRISAGEVPIEEGSCSPSTARFVTRIPFPPHVQITRYSTSVEGASMKIAIDRGGGVRRSGSARRTTSDPRPFVEAYPERTPPREPLEPNGLAMTPPMGWNTWNKFQTRVDDRTVREVADALVASGLRDAGYRYVVVDDGWQGSRDDSGTLRPNSGFPDMRALGAYVHERGLQFGIYSSPGPKTCAGYEGSWGHEERDARMFAAWGVDFLKYDWCSAGLVYELKDMGDAYARMARALRATGRPIVYSVCQYGMFRVSEWAAAAGGNLWRTTGDIGNSWESVSSIGFNQAELERSAKPGGWNDPDMLEVGNGGMTLEEERSHFTLWAMLAAPLFLGNDVRAMTPEVKSILSNRDVIAINQDALGKQASRVEHMGDGEIWLKPLSGGEFALAVFNRSGIPIQVDVIFAELGWPSYVAIRDVWKGDPPNRVHAGFAKTLKPHECALYRVRVR